MGYRTYLGKVSRKEYKKYHKISYKKLVKLGNLNADGNVGIDWDSLKSYETITEVIINNEREVLFKHTNNFFENYTNPDTTFRITDGKPFLEALIEDNRNALLKRFDKINEEKNKEIYDNLEYDFNFRRIDFPKKISKSKYLLTDVDSREYMQFNFIYLLKTFDFNKEVLVYIGY